ncbi:MAG: PGF-pre-PGF domain-containing protein, partial [Nanoarchaeota archaeon]
NLKDADVSEVKIEFKVEKKWFDQNSGSIKDIVLQRYFNELWTSIDTVYKRSDTTHNYFEATSPGLSLFAVVLKPKAVEEKPKPEVNETPINISGAAGNESDADVTAEGQKGKGIGGGKVVLFVVIAVIAVAAVGGGAFFIIKKKRGGNFSFPNPFSRFGGNGSRAGKGSFSQKSNEDEEAEKIVKEYESQRTQQPQQQQEDQRGRPPEAFN